MCGHSAIDKQRDRRTVALRVSGLKKPRGPGRKRSPFDDAKEPVPPLYTQFVSETGNLRAGVLCKAL